MDDQPLTTHEFSLLGSTLPLLDPWQLIRRLYATVCAADERAARAESDYNNACEAIQCEANSHRRLLTAVDDYLHAIDRGQGERLGRTLETLREEVAQSKRELGGQAEEFGDEESRR